MTTDQQQERSERAEDNDRDEKISEMITDTDTTRVKEADVNIDEDNPSICLNCGYSAISMSACHMKCPNCGTEKDCSETAIW